MRTVKADRLGEGWVAGVRETGRHALCIGRTRFRVSGFRFYVTSSSSGFFGACFCLKIIYRG